VLVRVPRREQKLRDALQHERDAAMTQLHQARRENRMLDQRLVGVVGNTDQTTGISLMQSTLDKVRPAQRTGRQPSEQRRSDRKRTETRI
jgi:hypothetical protein